MKKFKKWVVPAHAMYSVGGQDKFGIWLRHQDAIIEFQIEDQSAKENFQR